MGGLLTSATGTENDYSAATPYSGPELQGALNNYNQNAAQQQTLANQLQMQASGQGPSVSQDLLKQALSQNAANANSLFAGNRGVNSGMALRQAMMGQANANQAAAGQAAAMRSQEQLNAQGQLGGLYNTVGNQSIAQQGVMNAANQGAQQINAGVSAQNTNTGAGLVGGILGAGGSALGMAKAHGGMIQHFASGGSVDGGPKSNAGKLLKGYDQGSQMINNGGVGYDPITGAPRLQMNPMGAGNALRSGLMGGAMSYYEKKPFADVLSPGDTIGKLGATDLAQPASMPTMGMPMIAANGGMAPRNFRPGGKVPGKAQVKGDSYANDKVPAVVSPGEIVLPRSVTTAKDAPEKAKKFVEAILAKKSMGIKK